MNDRHDGYGDQYELIGYDANGQPVYRPVPHQRQPPGAAPGSHQGQQDYGAYDSYGGAAPYPAQQDQYGYEGYDDPYGTGRQQAVPPQEEYGTGRQPVVPPHDPYGTGSQPMAPAQDLYGTMQQPVVPAQDEYGTGRQPVVAPQEDYGTGPRPVAPPQDPYATGRHDTGHGRDPYRAGGPAQPGSAAPAHTGTQSRGGNAGNGPEGPVGHAYQTEQFSFVEEQDDESEDVIDWLKFTESRTERREEARRRARSRVIALVVVLALALAGGVGYLWYAGKLPALPGSDTTDTAQQSGPQDRDVIVVHLHNTKKGGTSTALLVDNTTTRRGTTILLPNSLALTDEDGTATTLGKSVGDDGSTGTRESIDTLLGTSIQGTWRLDTPYLENLVELVGNVDVTTDTDVPDPDAKKDGGSKDGKGTAEPLVHKGEKQTLSGPMAVAYATYRAPGERESAQLNRFGQVMQSVLRKMSTDPQSATVTVQTLAQILDPSLDDKDLGAFLAKLADHAKGGDYKTTLLPVQQDGTVSAQATDSVVKDLLGGSVKAPGEDAAVRVGVRNATGAQQATESARVALVNGGYTFVAGPTATAQASSQVTYAKDADKQEASEVAKTLGLPAGVVKKGKAAGNADISVVLGGDYDYKKATSQDTP